MSLGVKEKRKFRYSVRFALMLIFLAVAVLMIGLLNTYPTISSRNVVFSTKRSSMMNQASVMSVSLSALQVLDTETAAQVMELVDVDAFDRVVVTDDSATILYDTSHTAVDMGDKAWMSEVESALQGNSSFYSQYDGASFRSRAAAPIVSYGVIIGTVYIYENDETPAILIGEIQSRLLAVSIITAVVLMSVMLIFTTGFTRRISELVKAVRVVREGRYDYTAELKGADEITELTEEFNDMAKHLQSTEEMRRRFVSDASHELRTPLASIRLLSDSIVQSEGMDADTMRDFASDIGMEAERLQRMTEKLMNLTRKDSSAPVIRERVRMDRTIEKCIHILAPLAKEKNVRLFYDLQECRIIASRDDVFQIVFNLAENAVKYNGFGGNVFIKLVRRDGNAVLTIEDTGIGIPDEDKPYIFDRFYRVDKARSREAGGSGLGLSIVKDAVLLHNGTISVEDRESVGTLFRVTFPLADKEE